MVISGDHKNSDFRNKNLVSCEFWGADIRGSDFTGADLSRSSFVHMSDIDNVNFSGANLTGCRFSYSVITNTNFDSANLTGVFLKSANIKDTSFHNANLTRANLYNTVIENTNFSGAELIGADISFAQFVGVKCLSEALSIKELNVDDSRRGFTPIAIKDCDGEYIIYSGCRELTVEEALDHWGSPTYPNKRRGKMYVKGILALIKS